MLSCDKQYLRSLATTLTLFSLISSCSGRLPDGRLNGNIPHQPNIPVARLGDRIRLPVVSMDGTELPPYNTIYYFDQLIDHTNPSLGTFKQRYYHTSEYHKPGEIKYFGAPHFTELTS